ncbi:MAG: MGH1-like glycoside hydrolase domain-containing protein [Monoglobaceae bacterium]
MIEFKHKLPAMNIDGKRNGTYNNRELGFPSILTTDDPKLGLFIKSLRTNILDDRALVFIDGKILMCDKNWIRDHVHVMKAMRHWDYNLDSFLNFIIDTQRDDGQFYELIKQYDDAHWSFVNEDCYIMYPDDNLSLVRLELEADIEYLVVEGAMYLYRTTGDDEWLKKVLPKLEKGIDYITSDEKRWDKERGLVKRPFTIDTWDFVDKTPNGTPGNNRKIEEGTLMSIMHGDNSGVYQAMNQLAWFNRRLGNEEKALSWERRAEELKGNIFKYLWNGKFFMHQLHLNHDGVDNKESERLSLSNTYDINRGVTNTEQSRKIIEEYMERRNTTECFAEWFSIDPPYEKFYTYSPGRYVNGSISPFTAGELAKAAFNNGYEEYGWDIITRFMKLVERDGTAYFLYDVDSKPQPEGGPSAWGAAALISAIDEGLAGINDVGVNYDEIYFAPKFPVTYYTELRYITGYEVSSAMVDVRYILKDDGMRYDIYSPAETINAHILLPKDRICSKLLINSEQKDFEISMVGSSKYVDFKITDNNGKKISIEILF